MYLDVFLVIGEWLDGWVNDWGCGGYVRSIDVEGFYGFVEYVVLEGNILISFGVKFWGL